MCCFSFLYLCGQLCGAGHPNIHLSKVVDDDSEKREVNAQVRWWHADQTKKKQLGTPGSAGVGGSLSLIGQLLGAGVEAMAGVASGTHLWWAAVPVFAWWGWGRR